MINQMVLSSEIEWIGYESNRNMLQVEFIAGSVYQFEQVPKSIYEEFLSACSYTQYYLNKIRGKYRARKVRS